MLVKKRNQPFKFRTKNLVEINDYACEIYKTNSQINFKTTILKSNLCDYSDAYMLAKKILTVTDTSAINFDANNT